MITLEMAPETGLVPELLQAEHSWYAAQKRFGAKNGVLLNMTMLLLYVIRYYIHCVIGSRGMTALSHGNSPLLMLNPIGLPLLAHVAPDVFMSSALGSLSGWVKLVDGPVASDPSKYGMCQLSRVMRGK